MVRGKSYLVEWVALPRMVREGFMEEGCLNWVSEDEYEFSVKKG